MMNRIFYCIIFVSFFSCISRDKVPSDIIQPEKMKSLLWDVFRAQALAPELSRRDFNINDTAETKVLVQKVFEIHKIKSNEFDKSYNWYIKHPGIMNLIFEELYTQHQQSAMNRYGKKGNDSMPGRRNLLQWDQPYNLDSNNINP